MKRRRNREQDEADARERAERRRDALLAELKARQGLAPSSELPGSADPAGPAADAPDTSAAEPEPG